MLQTTPKVNFLICLALAAVLSTLTVPWKPPASQPLPEIPILAAPAAPPRVAAGRPRRDPFVPLRSQELFLPSHWEDAQSRLLVGCCLRRAQVLLNKERLTLGGVPSSHAFGLAPAAPEDWPDVEWLGLHRAGDRAVVHLGLHQGALAVYEWTLERDERGWTVTDERPLQLACN